MFKKLKEAIAASEEERRLAEERFRESLNSMSEKELLIELLIELKKVSYKCDRINRDIRIYSD